MRRFIAALPLHMVPMDAALNALQRLTAAMASVIFVRDWRIKDRGRPQFYKHRINLARWCIEPFRWTFAARGVYAREVMTPGCRVVDICCGDGSYSYLFFSDVAGHIDAVDRDGYAISYAKKYHCAPNIAFHQRDITAEGLPGTGYDVAVWNGAISYFDLPGIHRVLSEIVGCGTAKVKFAGMIPKANGWVDHKTEFQDSDEIRSLFSAYFEDIEIREVVEGKTMSYYVLAKETRRTVSR